MIGFVFSALLIVAQSSESISLAASNDFDWAPPPLEIDDLIGVPIDVHNLEASMTFDFESREIQVEALMTFMVDVDGGFPVFDLRQEIDFAELNGEVIDAALMGSRKISKQTGSVRILERGLAAGVAHKLRLKYEVDKPNAPGARGAALRKTGLFWDIGLSDLNPGRYLEQWFPANLIYDRHPFALELQMHHAEAEHILVSNAVVTNLAHHHWRLQFPAHMTALSPMVVLTPEADVTRLTDELDLGKHGVIQIELVKHNPVKLSLKAAMKNAKDSLKRFSKSMGPWPHGDRCTIYMRNGGSSMEYDGATTSSAGALNHELFHSWYGRGVKPASQNDGWFDEAWDVYYADLNAKSKKVYSKKDKPVTLCFADPWNRMTSRLSYSRGSKLFASIAKKAGNEKLEKAMASFFLKWRLRLASTADLERHLIEALGNESVAPLFRKFVYGIED